MEQRRLTHAFVLLAIFGAIWILAAPRSAGPDEPGHHVRAGALVRGQLDGVEYFENAFRRGYELPAHVGYPEPACFAFDAEQPASCAVTSETPSDTRLLGTRASDYPVWGHVLPGVGTLAPASMSAWAARALDAIVPLMLIGASLALASRHGWLSAGAVVLALTPMVWFTVAVVNPSGLAIAGGIGVWVALTMHRTRVVRLDVGQVDVAAALPGDGNRVRRPSLLPSWLFACSWAALVLPRRDGMLWAGLILAIAILFADIDPRALWNRITRPGQLVVVASTLATLVWASRSTTNEAFALFLIPLVPIAAVFAKYVWRRSPKPASRIGLCAGALVVLMAVSGVVMNRRAGGFDRGALRLIVGQTGNDFTEAVGLLGWLDTPIPTSALYVWFIGLGILFGAAVAVGNRSTILLASVTAASGVGASWVLAMLQNDSSGLYWQGRYYLPLLVGVPIVFGRMRLAPDQARRLGTAAAACGVIVTNAALAAMMRRYGVGVSGSLLPWEWDTYGAPLPPVVLLAIHVAASAGLVRWIWLLEPVSPTP